MTCDRCEEFRARGSNYCGVCGADLSRRPITVWGITIVSGIVCTLICATTLIFQIFTAYLKFGYMWDALEHSSMTIYYLAPAVTGLFEINGLALHTLFVVELIGITASIAFAFKNTIVHLRKEKKKEAAMNTPLFEVAALFGLLFCLEFAYLLFCLMFGVDLKSADPGSDGRGMFSLLNASIYEEALCRVLLLGLPIMVIAMLAKKDDAPWHRYLFGGFRYQNWMIIVVLFSSFFFGAGHLTNWGLWKFLPTFIFGLLSAYIFIKYGAYATVCMHFLTDFIMAGYWVTGSESLMVIDVLMLSLFSLPTAAIYGKKIWDCLKPFRSKS